MSLKFISIVSPQGHRSSLMSPKNADGWFEVVGMLPHGHKFRPSDVQEAGRMIDELCAMFPHGLFSFREASLNRLKAELADKVHRLIDGKVWDADTINEIADAYRDAGYPVNNAD